ncbi:GNAT family N-acetyltransferase [Chitinophaga sp. 30R24]|uniref:GNAT family N-acetyltransferase n=1 Tax=Chitinophaga sp. 30R24 TaxID=3248838 RepID=UPI003B911C37
MLEFRILEYGSCDYHAMVDLRSEVLRKPLGLSFTEEQLQQEMNDVLIGAFITTAHTAIAGCCILTPVNENIVQLRQMAVSPDMQGKGIGRDIVSFAEQYAHENGFNVLTLHARKVATGFYQKLGYETCGEEFIEVGIPHYEMRKNLK